MSITIDRMTVDDVPAIVQIIELAFAETAYSTQIKTCLPDHVTWVARSVGQVVAFIDGFITTAHDGTPRLELDLLAVHPDYHGLGIGKNLIRHFTRSASTTILTRALVAVDNHAMQHAIGQVKYTALPDTYHLYTSSHPTTHTSVPVPSHGHLVHVNTFTYRGIWLEAKIDTQLITASFNARQHDDEIIGAVILAQDQRTRSILCEAGFTFIKAFHWWQHSERFLG